MDLLLLHPPRPPRGRAAAATAAATSSAQADTVARTLAVQLSSAPTRCEAGPFFRTHKDSEPRRQLRRPRPLHSLGAEYVRSAALAPRTLGSAPAALAGHSIRGDAIFRSDENYKTK